MKDFMMVFLGADYGVLGLSPEEMQTRMGKWFAWNEKMSAAGQVKGGNALRSEVKRMSGADRTVTDIAAAEVKELIGGYYVVQANNVEEVIEIAKDFPDYDLGGTVEIREVMVFDR